MTSEEVSKQTVPVIRASVSYQTGQNTSLVFETYFAQDEDVSILNKVMDKLEDVATRQMVKGQIVAKRSQLEVTHLQLKAAQEDLERIREKEVKSQEEYAAAGRRTPYKPQASEQMARNNVEQNIKKFTETISRLEGEIGELSVVILGQAAE